MVPCRQVAEGEEAPAPTETLAISYTLPHDGSEHATPEPLAVANESGVLAATWETPEPHAVHVDEAFVRQLKARRRRCRLNTSA